MHLRRRLTAALATGSLLLLPGPAARADSEQALARGRAALEAGHYGEAESAFREATRGDPALSGAWLGLGMARYERGDLDGAVEALERALARDPNDAAAHYFLGLSLRKQGRHPDAIAHFEWSARLDPSYRQLALLQAGVSHRDAGDRRAARRAFERAIETAPDSEAAAHARTLRRGLRADREAQRRWSLRGALGIEFDDNVSVAELDASSGHSDVAGVFEAGGSYAFLRGPGYEARASYDFFQNLHADVSEADLQSHLVSLTGTRELGPVDLGLDYRFGASLLDGDGFLHVHQLLPSIGISPTDRLYASVGYDFRSLDFRSDGDRDAAQHAAVVRTVLLLGEGGASLALSYRLEDEDAEAPEFDYLGHEGGIRLAWPIAPFGFGLGLELGYHYAYRDYRHPTPSIGEKRDDQRHLADASLERRLGELLVARLAYRHLESLSDLPEADYASDVVDLSLRFEY